MRWIATKAKMKMTRALRAMHDMCTPLITGLWATHTKSVAYQLSGDNWNSVGVWMFLRVILPVLHHNPHPDFLNQIPSHGAFLIYKQNIYVMINGMLAD